MHDYEKMLFHIKLVYDTNPQKLAYSYRYFYALLYTSNFDTANELLNNSGFMGIFSEELKAWLKLDYHYYKSDFDKAFEYLDKLKSKKSYYYNKASIYAQKGAVHSAYQTLKHVPYLQNRAVIFALLKERDSMYYYLNKVTSYQLIEFLNGVPEFDPYRKDPEYKSFLKKNYFPVINN